MAKHEQSPFLLWWMLLLILLPVIGLVVYIAVYFTRKRHKIRFETISDEGSEEKSTQHQNQKAPAGVPEDTATHILSCLKTFEKDETYLNPGISLAGLAGDFDVGSGQLSKTIRFYKKKSNRYFVT